MLQSKLGDFDRTKPALAAGELIVERRVRGELLDSAKQDSFCGFEGAGLAQRVRPFYGPVRRFGAIPQSFLPRPPKAPIS